MNHVINYCSGGLGNRLKPLASCYGISQETGRGLGMIWNLTMRCGASYGDLFSNDIRQCTFEEICNSGSVSIYSHPEWIQGDYILNHDSSLKKLADTYGVISLNNINKIAGDASKYAIIYSNTFLKDRRNVSFFKLLTPVDQLRDMIDIRAHDLKLDDTVIGVHARGTDFEPSGINVDTYLSQVKNEIGKNKDAKFFICSDSMQYENTIREAFPGNIILNDKKHWVYKADQNVQTWKNNVFTSKESVQESILDMYLLSRTDFKIYHPDSSFAHLVNIIKESNR